VGIKPYIDKVQISYNAAGVFPGAYPGETLFAWRQPDHGQGKECRRCKNSARKNFAHAKYFAGKTKILYKKYLKM